MYKYLLVLVLGCVFFSGCGSASLEFGQLIADDYEYNLREYPLYATSEGDHRFNDKLTKVSLVDSARRNAKTKAVLVRIDGINRAALSKGERVSYDIFKRKFEDGLQWYEFNAWLMPVTQMGGFYSHFPQMHERVPFKTAGDYENYISRLNAFSGVVDGYIEIMREGIRRGYVVPKVTMADIGKSIEAHIVEVPEKSHCYKPFEKFSKFVGVADRERLSAAGREAISQVVVEAYKRFLRFMVDEYIPACRDTIAASDLPNGKAYYEFCIRSDTTLDISAKEVHETGLAEVARIKGEMLEVIAETGFKGGFEKFRKFLRTDKQFYAKDKKELLKEVAYALKRVDGELPRLFEELPRMPYGIKEVPDFIAHDAPAAYYRRPPGDGTMAGFYYVNTYDLGSRPLYHVEALAMHEAVPGHHLQIAIGQELKDLPKFRQEAHFTAFTEGWALYAESLGKELGLYEDVYSYFGRLDFEMLRACRLVVDTGIHSFGWSREKAIDFMASNTSMSVDDITTEVDRYIVWPGQALGYKIGELKIQELRKKCEERLGSDFDIRKFHSVVLGSGAVPLGVLETNINEWLEEQSLSDLGRALRQRF
ncbi:MAG: DUF885 domain-containing protein [Planctomycetes bacterium]|nr:DUF885 domain-containing protein [Planctomycetota bacterium]